MVYIAVILALGMVAVVVAVFLFVAIKARKQAVMLAEQAQERLAAQQTMFAQVQQLGSIGCFEIPLGTTWTGSESMICTEHLFNLVERAAPATPEFLTIKEFIAVLHPEDAPRVLNAFQQGFLGNTPFFVDVRALTTDHRIKYLRIGGTVEPVVHGHHDAERTIIGFVQDVTAATIQHNILKSTRTLLLGLTNSVGDGVMTFVSVRDAAGAIHDFQCTLVNAAAEQLLGLESSHLIARMMRDTLADTPLVELFTNYVRVVETGLAERFEYEWQYRQFSYWLYVGIVKLGDGFALTFSDITSRKHAEQELRLSESKLKALFNSSQEVYVLLDREHRITAYNSAALETAFRRTNTLLYVGQDFRTYVSPEHFESYLAVVEQAWNGLPVEREHVEIDSASGKKSWLLVRYLPVYNDDGDIFAVSLGITDITARRSAEQQQHLLQSVVVQTHEGVLITEAEPIDAPHGPKIIYVNRALEIMTGYRAAEMIGQTPRILQGPKTNKHELQRLKEALRRWEACTVEVVNYRKDGTEFINEFTVSPVANDAGSFTHWIAVQRDVTERRRAEEQLRANEAMLKRVQRMGKIGALEANLETGEAAWSENVYELLGRSPELVPKTIAGFAACVLPNDLMMVQQALLAAMKARKEHQMVEYRVVLPDGSLRYAVTEVQILYNPETWRAVRLQGFIQDITERRQAEVQRNKTEQLYKQLVESSPDAIAVIDLDGRFVSVNQRQVELLGCEHDGELLGRKQAEFIEEEHLPEFALDNPSFDERSKTSTTRLEVVFRRNDGSTFIGESSIVLLVDANNNPTGTLVISRDITERKRFEQALKEAKSASDEANRMKSEFVATISHEIRTPMNAIIGFAELLSEQVQDFMLDSYVQGINSAANNLLNLINDVLDLSKLEAGKMRVQHQELSLNNLLVELQQMFFAKIREKGLTFVIDTSNNLAEAVMLDEIRLRQVLVNLISNAIKFTDEGTITVRLSMKATDTPQRAHLTIDVIDTGIGIAEDQQEFIFEPFHQQEGQDTRRYGGTGLGLSICRRLIEIMNGSLTVKSTLGQGSTFTVALWDVEVTRYGTDDLHPNADLVTPQKPHTEDHHLDMMDSTQTSLAVPPEVSAALETGQWSSLHVPAELISILQQEVLPLWHRTNRLRNNLDIEYFAEAVLNLGKKYDVLPLDHYGQDLYFKTLAFKIAEMNAAFDHFPALVEQLVQADRAANHAAAQGTAHEE